MNRVLMVCSGNICRSPMAEGLLRTRFARLGAGTVTSAGIHALVGRPADPLAVGLLAERGVDISAHRARQLTPDLLAASDLVLVMEDAHRRAIEGLSRASRGRVHLLGRFGAFEIPDPYRRPAAAFAEALALIERGLDDFERAFWTGGAPAAPKRSTAA
jgi:protein-tyrosine phosphatase